MTNTLHRYGDAASFEDDYIIFAIPCKGKNDEGAVDKLKLFLGICTKHRPVNIGNSSTSSFRPSSGLEPSVHWKRRHEPEPRDVIEGVHRTATAAAVFDSADKAAACLADLIDADLGLSINVSTSVEGAKRIAADCGISRHSVEYSLGFDDPHDKLPDSRVLELSTMCGHGMVSANMAKKMLDMVQEGRRDPTAAAVTLARFCPCGAYNPVRAERLLRAGTST
ncbi:MAG: hypothetical protein JSW51_00915 [Gemmatimonadota bacterium]|nr:MAG: hypothetical protein JSW51_00915 [Gemmatimonadota bacterium]